MQIINLIRTDVLILHVKIPSFFPLTLSINILLFFSESNFYMFKIFKQDETELYLYKNYPVLNIKKKFKTVNYKLHEDVPDKVAEVAADLEAVAVRVRKKHQ